MDLLVSFGRGVYSIQPDVLKCVGGEQVIKLRGDKYIYSDDSIHN